MSKRTKKEKILAKQSKGITLIALVITIIVMLILVVVVIDVSTEGGLIEKAKKASDETQVEAEREQFELVKEGAKNDLTGEFDEVKMENELKGWTHEGEVWKSPNGNEFTLEGKTSEKEEAPDILKKYILGQDLQGRNLMEIAVLGQDFEGFKNEETTIDDASTSIEYIGRHKFLGITGDKIATIKYNSKYYAFQINMENLKTIADYGVVEIYKEDSNSKVGKKVNYDGKNWIIIYDDKTNGTQMISENVLEYKGNKLNLGNYDTYLEEKGELEGTTDLEKAIDSYNKAISTLNKACKEIVDTSPIYIKDVRSVGSNPKNKDSENTEMYKSAYLENVPVNEEQKYNGVGKGLDLNFVSDYERLMILGINKIEGKGYWLASRDILFYDSDAAVCFYINGVPANGDCGGYNLWSVSDFYTQPSYWSFNLRPVISLDTSKCNLTWDGTNEYYTISNKNKI